MEHQASIFKDDQLKGISLAIKNLQHQQAEAQTSNPDVNYIITKYNPHFRNLVNFIDLIFSFGLKDQRKGYWPFVKTVAHSSVVEMIEKHKKAENDIKKGYIWLFLTFIEDSLDSYIRMMIDEVKSLKFYYNRYALLRDVERREIFLNLLAGVEALTFQLMFGKGMFQDVDVKNQEKDTSQNVDAKNQEDPYLDFGHDPVLRQEKIVIRVQPSPTALQRNQPDVTLLNDKPLNSKYPDLISNDKTELSKPHKTFHQSISIEDECDGNDLVHHVRKKKKKKRRTFSENDKVLPNDDQEFTHDAELEEDNFIPEIIGSPEYTLCLPKDDSPDAVLKTSDPMLKSFTEGDDVYNSLLNNYTENQDEDVTQDNHGILLTVNNDDNELEKSVEDVETTLKRMNVQEQDGYHLTYVSDEIHEEEDYGIYRADSFDRFCRKSSPDMNSLTDEQGMLAETDTSSSPVAVAPQISEESLRSSYSPIVNSTLSKTSIDKLNDARLDTKSGILLPALPRRPDQDEASNMAPEITLDQNAEVLISLEIFQSPTESLVKVFKVFVGHLAGLSYPMYLLISSSSIYLLKKRETVQTGYVNMLSVDIDSINKVQIGLNFQEVFFIHDQGSIHVSTGDEMITRSIVSTVKSIIKSSQGNQDNKTQQPMAANTNNDLDLIIQDWLICNTGEEEPEILHYALVKFSALSSAKETKKVLKAGNVYFRHFLLGVMSRWEEAFFVLRGHILNHHAIKRNELKQSYDLSSKCGGCIRSGSDGNLHIFKIIGMDGKTPILELAVENENDANDWLMTICQVVADAKNSSESSSENMNPGTLISCGIMLTSDKEKGTSQDVDVKYQLFLFNQEPKSGRLAIEDSCLVQDITQVGVDNHNRTYCTLTIDNHIEDSDTHKNKTIWLVHFQSEYELGKFEQKLFGCWQLLYQEKGTSQDVDVKNQVPLQFVLLSEDNFKKTIHNVLNYQDKSSGEIGKQLLYELTSS